MPLLEKQPEKVTVHEEVLTLPEAAAYLRVSEDALLSLVTTDAVPCAENCRRVAFSAAALADWLRYGAGLYQEFRRFPPHWIFEYPPAEEMMRILEARLLCKIESMQPALEKRGSKQVLQKHLGLLRHDADMDSVLADLQERRNAGNARDAK